MAAVAGFTSVGLSSFASPVSPSGPNPPLGGPSPGGGTGGGTAGGGGSPAALSRTIERVLDDAQYTGEIDLSGRRLKEFPRASAAKYDLVDTAVTDLSRNRFVEVPVEVCEFHSLERLCCYHNALRALPASIVQLQNLLYLNLSRNQLTQLPAAVCHLEQLEVLLASNNRLVSLPEEIGQLQHLMQLDVSCNEVTQLPAQLGDLALLRTLNVSRNQLVELPLGLGRLKLLHLDVTANRIAYIPSELRGMTSLEELGLDGNPLLSPPAHICSKGLVHIMAYLQCEALREERRRGVILSTEQAQLHAPRTRRHPGTTAAPCGLEYMGRMSATDADSGQGSSLADNWDRSRRGVNNEALTPPTRYSATTPSPYCPPSQQSVPSLHHGMRLTFQTGGAPSNSKPDPLRNGLIGTDGARTGHGAVKGGSNQGHGGGHQAAWGGQGGGSGGSSVPGPLRGETSQENSSSTHASMYRIRSPLLANGATSLSEYQLSSFVRRELASPVNFTSTPSSRGVSSPGGCGIVSPGSNGSLSPGPGSLSLSPRGVLSPGGGSLSPGGASFAGRGSGLSPTGGGTRSSADLDEITRELQRQKAEYEARRKRAELLKQSLEEAELSAANQRLTGDGVESDRRRQAAAKLQQQTQQQRQRSQDSQQLGTAPPPTTGISLPVTHILPAHTPTPPPSTARPPMTSPPSSTTRPPITSPPPYGRATSDTDYNMNNSTDASSDSFNSSRRSTSSSDCSTPGGTLQRGGGDPYQTPLGLPRAPPTQREIPIEVVHTGWHRGANGSVSGGNGCRDDAIPIPISHVGARGGERGGIASTDTRTDASSTTPLEGELRRRHAALMAQHRAEAQGVRQKLEEERARFTARNIAVITTDNRVNSVLEGGTSSPFSQDAPPNSSFSEASSSSSFTSLSSLPLACRRALEAMSSDLISQDPVFTIRRNLQQEQLEREQLDLVKQAIESTLGVSLPGGQAMGGAQGGQSLGGALRDGVVLCHLANHVRPRIITSIHVPSAAVPKLSLAKCRRNVDNFLLACRQIGIDHARLCTATAVLEEKDWSAVAQTVMALLECGTQPKQSSV